MRTPKLDDEVLMSEPLKTYLNIAIELMPITRKRKDATPSFTPSQSSDPGSQSSTIDTMAASVPLHSVPTRILMKLVTWTKVCT